MSTNPELKMGHCEVAEALYYQEIAPNPTYMESEGSDVMRVDYDHGNRSVWIYESGAYSRKDHQLPAVVKFLEEQGYRA